MCIYRIYIGIYKCIVYVLKLITDSFLFVCCCLEYDLNEGRFKNAYLTRQISRIMYIVYVYTGICCLRYYVYYIYLLICNILSFLLVHSLYIYISVFIYVCVVCTVKYRSYFFFDFCVLCYTYIYLCNIYILVCYIYIILTHTHVQANTTQLQHFLVFDIKKIAYFFVS